MMKKCWKLRFFNQLKIPIPSCCLSISLIKGTLCYNQQTKWTDLFYDILLPLVTFLPDLFWSQYGKIFVTLVFFLCGFCVINYLVWIVYYEILSENPGYAWLYFITGGWLLLNASFNYIMAFIKGPGFPPEKPLDKCRLHEVCKKCNGFKPPRSHHCSSCNRCVLLMDHHCPWINNCVGYMNFRHFFLFGCFTCAGCFLIAITSNAVFCDIFYGDSLHIYPFPGAMYPLNLLYASFKGTSLSNNTAFKNMNIIHDRIGVMETFRDKCVTLTYIITSGVGVALLALCLVTARNISAGETTIEVKINWKLRKRLKSVGKAFHNRYNLGFKRNWKKFLGLSNQRRLWWNILLPSAHDPEGDGVHWETTFTPDSIV